MTPDDPRHGTQRGASQHRRDGEDPCAACRHGDNIASRRRRKRAQMGHRFTVPVGEDLYTELQELLDQGNGIKKLAEWSGTSYRSVYNLLQGGPEARVLPRTKNGLTLLTRRPVVTQAAITRRVQALMSFGYSARAIAEHSGVSATWVHRISNTDRAYYTRRIGDSLLRTYDELHMVPPAQDTPNQRRSVTQTKNNARRHGWPPPWSWNDIDDLNERPDMAADRFSHDDVDPVVVARILAGEYTLKATRAEKEAVVAAWPGSLAELSRLTGWHEGRYTARRDGAA